MSPAEVSRRVARERTKIAVRLKQARKKLPDGTWSEGDTAWVWSNEEAYFARLVTDPWKCDDGRWQVDVKASDGTWTVYLDHLTLDKKEALGKVREYARKLAPMWLFPEPVGKRVKNGKPRKGSLHGAVALKPIGRCCCGCGGTTSVTAKFLPGHDARYHGRMKKLADGRLSKEELLTVIEEYAVKLYGL